MNGLSYVEISLMHHHFVSVRDINPLMLTAAPKRPVVFDEISQAKA